MTATTAATPYTLPVRPHAIPAELRERAQWVAWQWERREEKWTKVPVNARTGQRAASDDPTTWTDFETARNYAATHTDIAGIGYVFSPDDPYTGIDFDTCRDPETGELDAWAAAALAGFDSYVEVSPSGTGIKAFVKATLPDHGIRRKRPDDLPGGMVEMYDSGRFFTVTGHHVRDTPATIHDAQGAVDALYARLTTVKTRGSTTSSSGVRKSDDKQATRDTLTDDELIALASGARNGAKFTALWMGSTTGYPSQSEADAALCSLLAFYTGPDAARIDRLFRQSRLMRPKWEERRGAETYGAMTVAQALASRADYWHPGERYTDNANASEPDVKAWIPPANTWPEPLADEAYYGLAGDFVRLIAPQTEADPVAILAQFLTAFGNCIGRSPHFMAEADRHGLNLYAVLVGESSRGRKGTSWGHVRRLFEKVDEKWAAIRILDGLSSGEGLIQAVRDPERDADGNVKDDGPQDKRLLVQASEFANVLQVQGRDGSTLSGHLRNAWDGRSLRTLTRTPLVATAPHISLLGHVTRDELLRLFDDTSAVNGYGNRFQWFAVRRSKLLPLGGRISDADLVPITARLSDVVYHARTVSEIVRDEQATAIWKAVYADLSKDTPGVLGAMTARAEPQVMRLACIYALLDCSRIVRTEHLLAALAVWAYCERSARWIFGDRLGDPVADEILRDLRAAPAGRTRTEISGLFSNKREATRITHALEALEARGLAHCEHTRPEGGVGRDVERWHAAMR